MIKWIFTDFLHVLLTIGMRISTRHLPSVGFPHFDPSFLV